MRIVCPTCPAEYDVPDSLVTAGRVVRCAGCGGEWMPVQVGAAEQEPVPPSVDDPPPIPVEPAASTAAVPHTEGSAVSDAPPPASPARDQLVVHATRQSSRVPLRLAWLASLAVLGFLGWAAYAWRAEIVAAWPPSARMYAAFGVQPVPSRME
jgi:predicted Zn finger-like uncharacterized protein